MILTDYYKGEKLTAAVSRYDVISSTGEYDLFETLLINKRTFNIGGLSFNFITRPDRWSGKKTDNAISKGKDNITSVKRPDVDCEYSFGDIKSTKDACILIYNDDWKKIGIVTIEIIIARGLRNDTNSLWNLLIDGELDHEIKILRERAVTDLVTK